MATPALLRRFWPYMARYKHPLLRSVLCGAHLGV